MEFILDWTLRPVTRCSCRRFAGASRSTIPSSLAEATRRKLRRIVKFLRFPDEVAHEVLSCPSPTEVDTKENANSLSV